MKTAAAAHLPPPDVNAHPALADADVRRRVHHLRLIAATARGTPRARLAAAELRTMDLDENAVPLTLPQTPAERIPACAVSLASVCAVRALPHVGENS